MSQLWGNNKIRNKQAMSRSGMSPMEAARTLNISQSDLYLLMQRGQIRSSRVNGVRVISRGALMELKARKCHSYFGDW
ncbi:MAG: helix-turn-helix domain-containing protein [Scytonematopsis contorta HA4267-MV1]|nr:helix-turn-helix domain-containing protein [Scytonematopsis contorta HA4267-MV1]